jgi:hypothetical protein
MINFARKYLMVEEVSKKQPIVLQYGMAKKSYFDMNEEERKEAAAKAFERVKEEAFSRGLPIIYGKKGYVIAEYVDGSRFVRENGKNIRPYYD